MRLLRRESRVRNVFSTALWSLTIYRQRIGSREFPCGSGGGRLMDWTRRCIDDAHASQPRRPISAILAVAGVVLLTVAGAGCGHSAGASNIAAGGNGSCCPTQGVGGDTLAPPCPSPAGGPTAAQMAYLVHKLRPTAQTQVRVLRALLQHRLCPPP